MKFGSTKDLSKLSQGLVLGPKDGEKLVRRWGHPFLIKIDPLNGGAKDFAVGTEKLSPGKLIHVHRHNHFEELLIIIAGKGMGLLEDKYIPVESGSLIFIPQGAWHGLENTGTEDIDLMWIFPRLGMEEYFRATSVGEGQSPTPLSVDEMNHIRANHMKNVEYRDISLKNYTK